MAKNTKARKDQVGALERKLEHQMRQVTLLRERNEQLVRGSRELMHATDAVIIELAKRYGEERRDEGTGELLGYRLPTAKAVVEDSIAKWKIEVQMQEGEMVIGVLPREEADGGESK